MPRNGSGSYTLPQAPFTPGTTISSSAVNSDFSDIASALTSSIASDGQTPIVGPLKQGTGILSAPSWTFTADTTAGLFLPATGITGLVAGSFGLFVNSTGSSASSGTPSSGGTTYAINDQITLAGGTALRPTVLQVASLSGSAVASVTVLDSGLYSALPSNPVSQASTTGSGSGATFTMVWGTAPLFSDQTGAAIWQKLGATPFMANLMSTQNAAALNAAITGGNTITPPSISSSQNNYSPTGISTANIVRVSASVPVNITGINSSGSLAAGRVLIIENVGTNNIVLTAQDTSSSAANRFQFVRPYTLAPNQGITLTYDSTSTVWRNATPLVTQPIVGQTKNLKIINDSGTPTLIFNITADSIILTDANGDSLQATGISTAPNISLSGAGGLDTGSRSVSTWYAAYVIYNPISSTIAGLYSLSGTSPTLPSGYTFSARVGWVRVGSDNNFMRTLQVGVKAQYVVTPTTNTAALPQIGATTTSVGSMSAPTWVALPISSFIPSTAKNIYGSLVALSTSTNSMAAPNNSYGASNSTTNPPPALALNATGNGQACPFSWVVESSNIYWATAGSNVNVLCVGWDDPL